MTLMDPVRLNKAALRALNFSSAAAAGTCMHFPAKPRRTVPCARSRSPQTPHCLQKRCNAASAASHPLQRRASAAPRCPQKRALSALAWPQAVQCGKSGGHVVLHHCFRSVISVPVALLGGIQYSYAAAQERGAGGRGACATLGLANRKWGR